ncbi:MAG: outer membrane protein OmpA-like peptidoglycan-associated protein [Myxococcota bacterium]|jgi:outer membrane protein OmpA-like peptidoglycan-associated protein
MRRLTRFAAVAMCLALLLPTLNASAGQPFPREGSVEVSLMMGGLFFLDDEAVPFDPEIAYDKLLESTFVYSLVGGYNFDRMFGVELALQLSPAETNPLSVVDVHLDFIYHPITHEWFVPFFGVGPSFSALIPQDDAIGSDSDPGFNVVAGMNLYPWDQVGFRVEARYLMRIPTSGDADDGRSEVLGHDLMASFGLTAVFGGEEPEPIIPIILDTDGDGILDDADACVTVPGVPSAQGCPDADSDTIADAADACPNDAGLPKYQGCPDGDGDTIVDKDDACPTEPGPVALQGCPDGDSDTIADKDDRCPKIPGIAEHQGCPPPPPPEVVAKFNGKIEGIRFKVGSAEIRRGSTKTLDEAVEVMAEYIQLKLMVEGHTSAEGSRELNLQLSKERAEAVKGYMVAKGIAGDRLETKGFGPDVPVAPDTRRGRKLNRRIEFKLLRQ